MIDKLLYHIENDIDASQFGPLSDILDCLVYRNPDRVIEAVLDIVYDKLLKTR
jgi:hypothetical protein